MLHPEPARTFWTPLANPARSGSAPDGLVIDCVLVAPGIRVLDAAVAFDKPDRDDATLYPSDHLGLVARLSIG